MKRQHITVNGEVKKYEYFYSSINSKPYCPNCNESTNYIWATYKGNRIKLGLYCGFCGRSYMESNKSKIFKVDVI